MQSGKKGDNEQMRKITQENHYVRNSNCTTILQINPVIQNNCFRRHSGGKEQEERVLLTAYTCNRGRPPQLYICNYGLQIPYCHSGKTWSHHDFVQKESEEHSSTADKKQKTSQSINYRNKTFSDLESSCYPVEKGTRTITKSCTRGKK